MCWKTKSKVDQPTKQTKHGECYSKTIQTCESLLYYAVTRWQNAQVCTQPKGWNFTCCEIKEAVTQKGAKCFLKLFMRQGGKYCDSNRVVLMDGVKRRYLLKQCL